MMSPHFVYLTKQKEGDYHDIRYKNSIAECYEDLILMNKMGDRLVKFFEVNPQTANIALVALEEYIQGKVDLQYLTDLKKQLIDLQSHHHDLPGTITGE